MLQDIFPWRFFQTATQEPRNQTSNEHANVWDENTDAITCICPPDTVKKHAKMLGGLSEN